MNSQVMQDEAGEIKPGSSLSTPEWDAAPSFLIEELAP
jgi:hypothetical protein